MENKTGGNPDNAGFDQAVLPHLDAAYNLARWLVRDPHDAEDVVPDACLRAVGFFEGYRGGNSRAWLLRIVRNTAYSFLKEKRPDDMNEEFNETLHVPDDGRVRDTETRLLESADSRRLQEALEKLPTRFREAIILRELEELSYKEIAEVMEIPIGTVMSSLARARTQLREALLQARGEEVRRVQKQ